MLTHRALSGYVHTLSRKGQAVPLFTPPGRLERRGGTHPLFARMSIVRGVSLLKTDGLYEQVQYPTAEQVDAADITYLGGHVYSIDSAEAADLTSAGYGDWITEEP